MRTSKAKKQSKLMYFISTPVRTLNKARNFYMRSLEDCAGKVGYGGGGVGVGGYTAAQVPLPRSFSVNSSSSSDDEDRRQFLRTVSSKRSNAEKENNNKAAGLDMQRRPIVRQPIVRQQPSTMSGMGMRSYRVGLKMGRIDEEKACSFREDNVNGKVDLYPRSRSYAVNKRNGRFA